MARQYWKSVTEEIHTTNVFFFFEDTEICSCVFWEELFPSQLPIMEPNRLIVLVSDYR